MKWHADAYRRVSYSAIYNGDLSYELLQALGCTVERGVRRVLSWNTPPLLNLSTQNATSPWLPLLTYLHTFIHFVWQY